MVFALPNWGLKTLILWEYFGLPFSSLSAGMEFHALVFAPK